MPSVTIVASVLFLVVSVRVQAQFLQQGPKLISPGAIGAARQGSSVGLSADGRTAVIGAPFDDAELGAAFVHERVGSSWMPSAKLNALDAIGNARQGWSVAIAEDGNTIIVGGAQDDDYAGAAWVHARNGGGGWDAPVKLVAVDALGSGAMQGWSVALSADGSTAIIGGPLDGNALPAGDAYDPSQTGAAWIASSPAWTLERLPQPPDLSAGANFGRSVAMSSDGNTALVGAPFADGDTGAAWIYERSGGTWSPLPKLVAPGSASWQGQSVALSGDGGTAVIGAPYDAPDGAAWVFTQAGGWTAPTKLVGAPGVVAGSYGSQGHAVSVAADGGTVIVGAPFVDDSIAEGGAWMFASSSGGAWQQVGAGMIGTGALGLAGHGHAVALSADGATAIVGGLLDAGGSGASWVYAQAPRCPDVFFEPVGDLPGDCYASLASDISANGDYVTVSSSADEPDSATDGGVCSPPLGWPHSNEAAGWTRPCRQLGFFAPPVPGVGGLQGLSYVPGSIAPHDESVAYGISRDGKVAVGFSNYGPNNETVPVAFLSSGIRELASLDATTVATEVSVRGALAPAKFAGPPELMMALSRRIIVGYSTTANKEPIRAPGARAVYWDSWTHVEPLPHPATWNGKPIVSSEANCISDDGRIVGGRLYYDQKANPDHYMSFSCVWRLDLAASPGGSIYTLMAVLDDLPGGDDNARIAHISGDGKVLVGWGTETTANPICSDTPSTACKWLLPSGPAPAWSAPVALTALSGVSAFVAQGTNQNGSVIVGAGIDVTGPCEFPEFESHAVIWSGGGTSLAPEVISVLLGPEVPGSLSLYEARRVSADGKTVIGNAFDPDFNVLGWVAGVP